MSGKLNIYNLGKLGVVVDKSPIHTEDGELAKAQNAIRDSAGSDGAIRKRKGLTKLNSVAMSGSVLGAINVPLNQISTRRFLIGVDQDVTTAYQWITSTDALSTTATATTPGACAVPADAYPHIDSVRTLTNRGLMGDGFLLYPGDYTRGAVQPIRIYDGVVDRELFTIPLSPSALSNEPANYAGSSGGVTKLLLVGTKLYIASHDFTSGAAPHYGRVLEYDFDTNTITQIGQACSVITGDIGAATGAPLIFYSLGYHQGFLYAGVGNVLSGETSTQSGVYRIRPGVDSQWTYDYDNSAAGVERPMCMASYKGLLYVGMMDLDTGTQRIMVRSETGAYTSSTTQGTNSGSAWIEMIVFGDNLYATSYDKNGVSSQTRIHKFDGSSWSVVKTITTGAAPKMGVSLVVHNDRLYCLAIDSSGNAVVTHSSDGTVWTDQTTNLTGGNIVSVFGVFTD